MEREHVARYRFAQQYCRGKTVADIACGTGYGSEILREVAVAVDGYDRESLCGNHVIDLDQQGWSTRYDVIVSFETIEHLRNPGFFLDNVRATADLLIVSTPIGESRGYNPFHHQVWTLPEFMALLEERFSCQVYHQHNEAVTEQPEGKTRFVIAVCRPR